MVNIMESIIIMNGVILYGILLCGIYIILFCGIYSILLCGIHKFFI